MERDIRDELEVNRVKVIVDMFLFRVVVGVIVVTRGPMVDGRYG